MKVCISGLKMVSLAVGLACSFSAMAIESHKEVSAPPPVVDSQTVSSVLNLNTADAQAIANAHIKGIGKKRAEAIIAYRQSHGPFKSVDDLKQVKGLSDKVIDNNRSKFSLN